MRKTMPKAEKDYIIRAMPGMDDLLLKVLWQEMSKGNGIQIMDFDVLQAFYDEFEKRPHVLEKTESEIRNMMGKMTESYKRRNTMRLTKRQLKRIIREEYSKLIKESSLPKMDRSMMRRLYDWVLINEENGDPQNFLGTIDTFFEAESDAEMPVDGMEEEVHQSLHDLQDLYIVSGVDDMEAPIRVLVNSWEEAEGIIDEIESYENEIN